MEAGPEPFGVENVDFSILERTRHSYSIATT
jgi:hypothetical protein